MFEAMGLFLLDQVFEDADIFGLRDLDSKCLIQVKCPTRLVTENDAVEQEKLRWIHSPYICRGLKDSSKISLLRHTCGCTNWRKLVVRIGRER